MQPFGVLHLTYDTYFARDAAYPVDVGVTSGVLPSDLIQVEVGFDAFYPTLVGNRGVAVPLVFHAKMGTPQDAMFRGQPGLSLGIFGVGLERGVTNQNVLYGVIGRTLPYVGTFSVGGYFGLNADLLRRSDGRAERAGVLASWVSPSVEVGRPVQSLQLVADVQTGRTALGGAGGALFALLAPGIGLGTGPVFFFEPMQQPGQSTWMWSVQLDVDLDLTGGGGTASES